MRFCKLLIAFLAIALLAPVWGAMDVKKGVFTGSGCVTPCTQDITDAGFQPKMYCLFYTLQAAAGLDVAQGFSMGCTDGTTSRTASVTSVDNVATTDATRLWGDGTLSFPGGVGVEATHSAMLSNGFRVQWPAGALNTALVHYVAWGGADITNTKVTSHTFNTGTGNQAYTGVGFKPDFVCLLSANHTALAATNGVTMSFGCGVSSTKRWAWNISSRHGVATTATIDAGRYQRTDSILLNVASFAEDARLDLVTLDSDGFTLNQVNAPAANLFASIAFKGGSYDVGSDAMCTTGSCVDTITPVAAPKLVIVSSWALAASTTITADSNISFGAFDASAEGNSWTNQEDAILNTRTDRQHLTSKCLSWDDQVAATPTITDEADCAISGSTFTATWTTNSGTARQWLWASFGNGGTVVKDVIMRGVIPGPR